MCGNLHRNRRRTARESGRNQGAGRDGRQNAAEPHRQSTDAQHPTAAQHGAKAHGNIGIAPHKQNAQRAVKMRIETGHKETRTAGAMRAVRVASMCGVHRDRGALCVVTGRRYRLPCRICGGGAEAVEFDPLKPWAVIGGHVAVAPGVIDATGGDNLCGKILGNGSHSDISFPGLCPCQMVDYLDLRTTSARTASGSQAISNKIDSNPAPPQARQNRRAVVCLVYLAYSSGWAALRALESSRDDVTAL